MIAKARLGNGRKSTETQQINILSRMYHTEHKYSTNFTQFELKTPRIAGDFAELLKKSVSERGRQLLALRRSGTLER